MDFRPINDTERRNLINAVRQPRTITAPIRPDRAATIHSSPASADEVTDDEVIAAIKSVPSPC